MAGRSAVRRRTRAIERIGASRGRLQHLSLAHRRCGQVPAPPTHPSASVSARSNQALPHACAMHLCADVPSKTVSGRRPPGSKCRLRAFDALLALPGCSTWTLETTSALARKAHLALEGPVLVDLRLVQAAAASGGPTLLVGRGLDAETSNAATDHTVAMRARRTSVGQRHADWRRRQLSSL